MMISFKVGEKEYKVVKPNAKQQAEANRIYAEEFSKLLKEGKLMVREEMITVAKQRGIWSEEKDLNLDAARKEIISLQDKIEAGGYELQDAFKDAERIKELRTEILTQHLILNSILNNTVEQQADNTRLDYLASVCIANDDGSPYCSNLDEFVSKDDEVITTGLKHFNEMVYGSLDELNDTPESKFLKEYGDKDKAEVKKKVDKKKESKPFLKNGKPIK